MMSRRSSTGYSNGNSSLSHPPPPKSARRRTGPERPALLLALYWQLPVPRQLDVAASSRRRADIGTLDFDPGMGLAVAGSLGQADDELRRKALMSQEPVQHERAGEAPGAASSEAEHPG